MEVVHHLMESILLCHEKKAHGRYRASSQKAEYFLLPVHSKIRLRPFFYKTFWFFCIRPERVQNGYALRQEKQPKSFPAEKYEAAAEKADG